MTQRAIATATANCRPEAPAHPTDLPAGRAAAQNSAVQRNRRKTVTTRERRARYHRGMVAEYFAAAMLMLKGYRILARRHRTRLGEIDLIAVRGKRLAFVEVKRRPTIDEAMQSIGERQTQRIAAAAEQWVWQHPAYKRHEIGLDAVVVAANRWPRHIANALQSC
jgi:putative endonuclease